MIQIHGLYSTLSAYWSCNQSISENMVATIVCAYLECIDVIDILRRRDIFRMVACVHRLCNCFTLTSLGNTRLKVLHKCVMMVLPRHSTHPRAIRASSVYQSVCFIGYMEQYTDHLQANGPCACART
jgi:hypothetical protein